MPFSVSQPETSPFHPDGLREYFEYRDLGVKEATGGAAVAHVIRARGGHQAGGEWHCHDTQFQMVYVMKGWVRFEYEGQGEVVLKAGSCVYQPPGIRHREIEHSGDLEMLEVVTPGQFETRMA